MLTITNSQFRALSRLGQEKDDVMRAWGRGFGLRRSSVRALHRLGLVDYDEHGAGGICCRITAAGRIALVQVTTTMNRSSQS